MKIAMLGQKRIPSREGGVEIVVEELSTRMVKKGHEVTCYNRGGKHALDKNIKTSNDKEYKGVKLSKCFTIDKKGLAAMTASFFGTIKAIFSKNEVVHYHAEGPCAWMWLVKWFTNKKIVATIHGLDWQRAKWGGFATKYIKFGEKCAAKYADEIIVLSENVKQYFKETYNRETNFIPNGVNKPEIRKAEQITEKYQLKKDEYILFLGRIVPEKGIHYLIDAYNDAKVDKKLVIAGAASDTDTYYTELKEKAKTNKNIIFTGFVQGQILEELYSNAYVYCLPSDLEGMPLSLLEGMSYSNCCLTSDIKECSEVLQDKGVTFEKSSVKDLTRKIKELCSKENEVKKYKEEAQEYITKKYNWDDVVDKTIKIYQNPIDENRNVGNITIPIIIFTILFLGTLQIKNNLFNCICYLILYLIHTFNIYLISNKQFLNPKFCYFAMFSLFIGLSPIAYFYATNNLLIYQLEIISVSLMLYTLGTHIFNKRKKEIQLEKYVINDKKMIFMCHMLLLFAIIGTIIYITKNYNLLFSGNFEDGRIAALSGNGIILQMMSLGTIAVCILFEYVLKKKYPLKYFILVLIISSICVLFKGFRSGMLSSIIIMVFIYNKIKKINFKKIFIILLVLVLSFAMLGIVRSILSQGSTNVFDVIMITLKNGTINFDKIYNMFGHGHPFQRGYTYLINIKMMLPGPDQDFTLWLKDMLNMSFSGGGVTPTILGELYMNFNMIGVYVGMTIIGIIASIIDKYYSSSKNLYYSSYLVYVFIMINGGGFANVEVGLIITTIVYLGLIILCKGKKKNEEY